VHEPSKSPGFKTISSKLQCLKPFFFPAMVVLRLFFSF